MHEPPAILLQNYVAYIRTDSATTQQLVATTYSAGKGGGQAQALFVFTFLVSFQPGFLQQGLKPLFVA